MNRREALSATAALLGVSIVGADSFLTGCTRPGKSENAFRKEYIELLDEIGETILPASQQSPGAKAAGIGSFMKSMVMDCYSDVEQSIFFEGLKKLDNFCIEKKGDPFLKLSSRDRHNMLTVFDEEAFQYNASKQKGDADHFFSMIKQLTIWGYFSSEPGATKALRYVPIPGRYIGCVDYHPGEGAWVY